MSHEEGRVGRRDFLKYVAGGVAGVVIGGVGGYLAGSSAAQAPAAGEVTRTVTQTVTVREGAPAAAERPAPTGPLKIAVMGWFTGPYAFFLGQGADLVDILVDEINAEGGIGGRKVEVIKVDTPSPDVAVKEFRRVVVEEKVEMVHHTGGSGLGLAITPLAEEFKVPTLLGDVWSMALYLEKDPNPKYVFRIANNDAQVAITMGEAVKEFFPDTTTIGVISPDYAWGRDVSKQEQEAITALMPGVKTVVDLFPKVGESDYTPFITKIMDAAPDTVLVNLFAGDFITFTKQAIGMGFYEKLKNRVVIIAFNANVPNLTKDLVPEGLLAHATYHWFLYPPKKMWKVAEYNDKFIEKTGKYPTYNIQSSYVAIMAYKTAVERALEKLGRWPSNEEVVIELKNTWIQSPAGWVGFRPEDNQGVNRQFVGITKYDPDFVTPILDNIRVVEPEVSLPPPGYSAGEWIKEWA